MILVDISIWVDHLRAGNRGLVRLLEAAGVLGHPFVLGELALGNLRQRKSVLALLAGLPQADMAENGEVLVLISNHRLAGVGIGYIDAHLLCSAKLTSGAKLWTRDRRLAAAAADMGVGYDEKSIPS